MTADRDAIRRFFRLYDVSPVGATPVQPNIPPDDDEKDEKETVDLSVELPADAWNPLVVSEAPARAGEFPTRFIDGSQAGQPVLCVRAPLGWPIPLVLSEVGAVALKSVGRGFEREFVAVERVLSFVADPFPWEEVEAFADCLLNKPELRLRVLPANRPPEPHSPFDYEVMRTQARARAQQEMTTLERLAVAVNPAAPTLVDGPLNRVMSSPDPRGALRVGVIKQQAADYLHEAGWRTLLSLNPGCRTPVFRYDSKGNRDQFPVASWFLKLAGGPRLAPNWGYVRVEVPWGLRAGEHPDSPAAELGVRPGGGAVGSVPPPRADRRPEGLRLRQPPVAVADRRPLSHRQLRPDAGVPRPHRAGRGRPETAVHADASAGQPPVPHGRPLPGERTVSQTRTPLGRVAAPPEHESTSGTFYFWVDKTCGVERTQIVTTASTVGTRAVKFVGIVQEVYRRSRQKDIGEEASRFDGRSGERPMFDSEGVTYAEVAILRTTPVAHTPPTEESEVFLATPQEAREGYGVDRMEHKLPVGLLRNGGTATVGPAFIDLDFLLGANGGHLNVNGIAGVGTKSTFLLMVNWLLLREAKRQLEANLSGDGNLQVVPVIFNVKNFDLFFIDRWNKKYRANEADHKVDWAGMGIPDPKPFDAPTFRAPQLRDQDVPVRTGGRHLGAESAYSWSLSDVIEHGLFKFLFGEDDIGTANLGGLVNDVEEWLTSGPPDAPRLRTTEDAPQTFQDMLDWFKKGKPSKDFFGDYQGSTKGSFYRRLKYIVLEGNGVLRRNDPKGKPIRIPEKGQTAPWVIDLYGLQSTPSLQRFVVAAVFHQIQAIQSKPGHGALKYLITLDELNRFAPKDSSDPITQKLETVASEGRSQGIILFGAQQQASLVKSRVIENAAVRAVGRSGTLELGAEVWKFLGPSARSAAAQLQPDEKLLYLPSFREPMLAKIPFPPFALSEGDVDHTAPTPGGVAVSAGPPNQDIW